MSLPPTTAEFATYLNDPGASTDARATLILGLAVTLCETIVNPLPAGGEAVVYDVAARAYANPAPTRDQSFGLYAQGEGPYNDAFPGATAGGLWLTANNEKMLRVLAGRSGGAFTIDTLPTDYTVSVPWWDSSGALDGWDTPT